MTRPHFDQGTLLYCVQLKLIGPPCGLSVQEAKDLWALVDVDGNGLLNFKEFQVK